MTLSKIWVKSDLRNKEQIRDIRLHRSVSTENLPGIGDGDTETARMIVMIVTERFMVRLKTS